MQVIDHSLTNKHRNNTMALFRLSHPGHAYLELNANQTLVFLISCTLGMMVFRPAHRFNLLTWVFSKFQQMDSKLQM